MWEMWFIATTQPPEARILSPSIHSCFVVVSSSGLMMTTTVPQAQPRFSCSLRTFTIGASLLVPDRAGREYRRGCEDRLVTTPLFTLLVPVKDGPGAKSRLSSVGDAGRAELMAAFARDAIGAARQVATVEVCLVGDPITLRALADDLGVRVLPDEGRGDLNRALRAAAGAVTSERRGTAVMLADLPCLRPTDLGAALTGVQDQGGRVFVADAAGTGTTLLAAGPGRALDPRFGSGSAAAHRDSGAQQV